MRDARSAPLKIKEVRVENRRYVVCLNEEERRKDAHDREAIVAHLKEQLRQGDKSLVGNKGYRRYLKVQGDDHFAIDEKQVKIEARYDRLWVLRTNTVYNAETAAHVYKALWTVEDIFRTAKSIMDTRAIYHRCNETIRGHRPGIWASLKDLYALSLSCVTPCSQPDPPLGKKQLRVDRIDFIGVKAFNALAFDFNNLKIMHPSNPKTS